jgi:DNA-binding SARP family transcriptional activator/Tfp pilus assembly protein PilF
VAALRRLAGDLDSRVLVTQAPGYRLMVAAADLDVFRFEDLVSAGRAALEQGDGPRAAEFLAAGLVLWRGPVLAGVPQGPLIAAEAARLDELRVDALELRAEAGICCGRAPELVGELRQLTAGHPLRERFWHQLMRALEQAGRPAQALEAYEQARKVLAEELGADPGPDLQQLHRRLLAGGMAPAARPAAAPPAVVAAAPAVLRQLPAAVPHFAGRTSELAALTGLLGQARTELPGTVMISAVDGMPGVGKTALAVQTAHLIADRFPDRQLFADLHGHTPGRQPADPADVLAALLAADGVDPRYLPADLDERAAMWRDRMAGQRALLILDNAASSAQVAPLLPGTSGCLVLITSRRFLGDLPATADVPLDVLPPGDACAMFGSLAPRATNDPDRVAEVVALCGHLPLAISLLARLYTRHRAWTMADLITETRARLLTVTAENRTVAAAFEASYHDLDAGRRRFFRYLGLHPGPEIDAYGAAALAGLPLGQAAGHLDALHGDRLLDEPVPRRYRMHDLIRQYARSLASSEPADQRDQATGQLLDYYQHTAQAADAHLTRFARTDAVRSVRAPGAAPGLPGRDEAQAWMTAERANLLACIDDAATRHDHARVASLTAAVAAHLRSDGPWPLAITFHTAAVQAARHLGDRQSEACALNDLGAMWLVTSGYQDAAEVLGQALDLCRAIGDRSGEARTLLNLGITRQQTDDRKAASAALEQALEIYRDTGDRPGEASALLHLGDVRRVANNYGAAADAVKQALEIYRDAGDRPGEANSFFYLGVVRHMTGDFQGAAVLLEQALNMSRSIGSRLIEANSLCWLGDARRATGDFPSAAEVLEQSRDVYRTLGGWLGEANAMLFLGDVRQMTGDFPGAAEVLEQAQDIYRKIGDRMGQANILCRLASALHASDDLPGAAEVLEQAQGIYRDIGDRLGEAEALNQAGTVNLTRGDPQQALACYQSALEITRDIDNQLEEARALEGTGKCAALLFAADTVDGALQQALDIYQRLGVADAARLAAQMNLSPGGPADTAQVSS